MKNLIKRILFPVKHTTLIAAKKPMPSLKMCIALDLVGYVSFAIPFFGELFDFVWAPVSALIYWRLFGFKKGFFGGWFSMVEELLPGFDLIPTFTITWFIQNAKRAKESFAFKSLSR